MCAIKDSNQRSTRGIDSRADKVNTLATTRCHPALAVLMNVLAVWLFLAGSPVTAAEMVQITSIAQITIDDDGRTLKFPVNVFFDPVMQETYIINGSTNRVVVYGPDFFPRVSIGIGRGVITPRGGTVMSNGEVYIPQVRTSKNPSPRITILNGAFFVDREIFLDEIPEAADFVPRHIAVSPDGLIYLAGNNNRGVIVLDNEGNFLRWLRPKGQIIIRTLEEAERLSDLEEKQTEPGEVIITGETEEMTQEEDIYANIPEEFRPSSSRLESFSGAQEIHGPVKINHITIDNAGNLYLISAETGKIYVYGPDESFLFAFGTKGGSPGQMSNPRSLTIDEELGVIYVVDYMRHSILAYDMTGEYLFDLGGRGNTPGWFNFPNDIAINNQGQIIVADLFNKRVQVLEVDKEGIYYYMGKSSFDTETETSDAVESTEQDELSPGQPDGASDQENKLEPPMVQPDSAIKEEMIQDSELPVKPLPELSDPVESSVEDEFGAGQLESLNNQENVPETPMAQPDGVIIEEEIIEDFEVLPVYQEGTNDQESAAEAPLGQPEPESHFEEEQPGAPE